jgi:uncharacterized membrane protein
MTKRAMMLVFALIGLGIGIYLTLYHYGVIGELTCSTGSCERVQTSKWSMLFGIPVATWGLGFYATVLVLAGVGLRERYAESRGLSLALVVLTGWGVLFSGWLTYLEAAVINAWCQWCVGSAIVAVLIFICAVGDWLDRREEDLGADS